jgi:hypothetical protein
MHATRSRICSRSINSIFAYCIPHHRSVQGCDGQGLRCLLPLPIGTFVDTVIDFSAPLSRAPFCEKRGNVTAQGDVIKLLNGQDLQQSHGILGYNLCVTPVNCTHCSFSIQPKCTMFCLPMDMYTSRDKSLSQTRRTQPFLSLIFVIILVIILVL